MSLQSELGLSNPIETRAHEALMNVVLTGELLAKEGHRLMRPLGLTDAQFNVLMLLKYQSENGELSQTSLGNMLVVNRSNVTGLIDRLEQAGLVKRTADSGDRRVNKVRLTTAGQKLLGRAEKAYLARVEEVMGTLTNAENAQLCSLLERIRRKLSDTGE
ncbi:MAG: MarR family transcriptional regulator [bacterium]